MCLHESMWRRQEFVVDVARKEKTLVQKHTSHLIEAVSIQDTEKRQYDSPGVICGASGSFSPNIIAGSLPSWTRDLAFYPRPGNTLRAYTEYLGSGGS